MMVCAFRRLALGLGVLSLATAALFAQQQASIAQQQALTVDPAKSEVHFTLADPLHAVNGTFQIESGSVDFNTADGTMSGGIDVNAASGATGNGTRDKKMTQDQMKAPSFATVTFAPTQYTGTLAETGDSTITVEGVLTLLGKPHAIILPMQVHIAPTEAGAQCRATGTFEIPYVQWGMKDPSNFLFKVGKNVTVHMVLVGSLATAKAD